MKRGIAGNWRIVEMELWDRDTIDLVGPAFIEFRPDGTGHIRFIAVQGHLDHRSVRGAGLGKVEFSWEGTDEGDQASGRGSAQLDDDGSLCGRIFFHMGDDSGFRAVEASRLAAC